MRKVLTKQFFNRPVLQVAPDLLGTFLVRRYRGKEHASMIVETEAYDGQHDLACHAKRGKSARNAPMFDEGGVIYVYFTYGMHWMLNFVTGEREYPAAVLLRGLEDVSGPARLTKKLHIDKRLNHKRLGKDVGLWVENRGVSARPQDIQKTPRIGVSYAGEVWANKPYRFVLTEFE